VIERGPAAEVDMQIALLRAEIDSSRWGHFIKNGLATLGFDRRLIDEPNMTDVGENHARKSLLLFIRSYTPKEVLFVGFPVAVKWRRAALQSADFETLRYGNHKTWVDLSDGTRLVSVGARNFLRRPEHAGIRQIDGILAALREGVRLPELIVAQGLDGSLILIEGHSRATAYVISRFSSEVEVIIGSSPDMPQWAFY
jgi:hypothetical protein